MVSMVVYQSINRWLCVQVGAFFFLASFYFIFVFSRFFFFFGHYYYSANSTFSYFLPHMMPRPPGPAVLRFFLFLVAGGRPDRGLPCLT